MRMGGDAQRMWYAPPMWRRIQPAFHQQRILGGAFVLAVTQVAASLMGLLRDRALTRTFPGLETVDVYIASFRPSDLLFQILIMAGLSTVLVPLLSRYRADDRPQELSALLSSIVGIGLAVFGGIALVLAVFFPLIAPGLVLFRGEALELYITYGRLALFTNFLFVAGNAFGQHLITVQRYWLYGLTPVLYTAGTITGTLWLTPIVGETGPMLGTLGGAIAYVAVRVIASVRAGFHPVPRLWHPDLKRMGWLMVPRMFALGALQAELLFFDAIASGLPDGAVTINAYARNFQSVVVGAAGIALAQSAFPLLSQAAAKKDRARFWTYVRKGVLLMLAVTIPGAIVLAFAAPLAAWLVHLTDVLPVFALALGFYAVSIPFESINHLLLRSFYALHSTTVPAFFNVLNGVTAVMLAAALVPRFGVYALAIGFTAGQLVQMTGLSVMLKRATNTAK